MLETTRSLDLRCDGFAAYRQ